MHQIKNKNDGNQHGEEKDSFFIDGREGMGKFTEKASIHEVYAKRPEALEKITSAQFAIMYEVVNSNSTFVKNARIENGVSDVTDHCSVYHTIVSADKSSASTKLPNLIQVKMLHMPYYRCRKQPYILHTHKFTEDIEPHEYYYSELFLFTPWRGEDELFDNYILECFSLWNKCNSDEQHSKIQYVMHTLFPTWPKAKECSLD